MEIEKNKIEITSVSENELNILLDFYEEAYPLRYNFLKINWKWLYHTDYDEIAYPLVLVYKNKIIGHAGKIPVKVFFDGNIILGSWFVDFKILPEFQKKGLGTYLTKEWMRLSDIQITICNDVSIEIFKKAGWIESKSSFLHINFVFPFDHPGLIRRLPVFPRRIFNYLNLPFFFLLYKINSHNKHHFSLEKFSEQSFKKLNSLTSRKNNVLNNQITTVFDDEFFKWRILNSPNVDHYYIYKTEKVFAIISINDNHGKYIDILWVSDLNNKTEIRKMISTLGIFGMKNNIAYIRFYTSRKELSDYLKKNTLSILRSTRFAYYSKNESIMALLKLAKWEWQLIDSDFEHFK